MLLQLHLHMFQQLLQQVQMQLQQQVEMQIPAVQGSHCFEVLSKSISNVLKLLLVLARTAKQTANTVFSSKHWRQQLLQQVGTAAAATVEMQLQVECKDSTGFMGLESTVPATHGGLCRITSSSAAAWSVLPLLAAWSQ